MLTDEIKVLLSVTAVSMITVFMIVAALGL